MKSDIPPISDEGIAFLFQEALSTTEYENNIISHPALRLAQSEGYVATSLIAKGGTSEVWRGIDQNTGRDIAIKVPIEGRQHADIVLERESEVLAKISPPWASAMIRRGGKSISFYIVLEFIEGGELSDSLESRVQAHDIVRIMSQVCEAVGYLHSEGIAHGDLKFSNVLIRTDGSPVLIDFGMSSWADVTDVRLAGVSHLGGTHHFVAPEIANKSSYVPTPLSDVYTLGVMLADLFQMRKRSVPPSIKRIIERAAHQDPSNRYESASQIKIDLEKYLESGIHKKWYAAASLTIVLVALLLAFNLFSDHSSAIIQSDLESAASSIDAGVYDNAIKYLAEVPQEDRGWEWRHLWYEATSPPAVSTVAFPANVIMTSIAPNSDWYMVGTSTGEILRVDYRGNSTVLYDHDHMCSHLIALDDHGIASFRDGHVVSLAPDDDPEILSDDPKIGDPVVCWQAEDTGARVYSLPYGQIWNLHHQDAQQIAKADGAFHAITNRQWFLLVHDAEQGKQPVYEIYSPDIELWHSGVIPVDHYILSFDMDASGQVAAIGLTNGSFITIRPDKGPPSFYPNQIPEGVSTIVVDREENRLFMAGEDLYIYDLKQGKYLLTLSIEIPGIVRDITWDRESGTLTAASSQGAIRWISPPIEQLALH